MASVGEHDAGPIVDFRSEHEAFRNVDLVAEQGIRVDLGLRCSARRRARGIGWLGRGFWLVGVLLRCGTSRIRSRIGSLGYGEGQFDFARGDEKDGSAYKREHDDDANDDGDDLAPALGWFLDAVRTFHVSSSSLGYSPC